MADVVITAEPKIDTYSPGKRVVLSWTKPANSTATKWQVVQDDAPAQTVDLLTIAVTVPEGKGPTVVKITGIKADGSASGDEGSISLGIAPVEAELLIFSPGFAWVTAIVIGGLAGGVLWFLTRVANKLLDATASSSQDRAAVVGGAIGLALTAVGLVIVVVGAWAALLEVRGRLRTKSDLALEAENSNRARARLRGIPDPKVIQAVVESVGKLKGPALMMVVGLLVLLSAAWIGNTAVEPSTPTTTTITTDSTPTTDSVPSTDSVPTSDSTPASDPANQTTTTVK